VWRVVGSAAKILASIAGMLVLDAATLTPTQIGRHVVVLDALYSSSKKFICFLSIRGR
jgi:hypothetical protein